LIAAERFGKIEGGLESIKADVTNVIRAVTRNMSMYWTIIDILTNRKDFSQDVEKAVNEELKEWGMRLIELEVIHFVDIEGYTVIKDLEERQATVINSETRKLVASQIKEAAIVESNALKETETVKASNEEAFRQRQIQKDEAVGKREQEKEMTIAEQTRKANEKKIEAERTLIVGGAMIEKDATITKAEGLATAEIRKGEATAQVTKMTGEAEGDVIRAKGFADADSTDKRAEALRKYNEAGIGLEVIKASQTVQIEQARAWAEAMRAAKVQVYSGGESGRFFGLPLSPQGAFNLGAFAEIAKEHGIDLQKIGESIGRGTLPIADVTKVIPPKGEPEKAEGKKDVKK
jgi:flotillin